MKNLYQVKTQQGFSQHSIYLSLKDANTINEIFVRNRIWHTITDPDGKEVCYSNYNKDNDNENVRPKQKSIYP